MEQNLPMTAIHFGGIGDYLDIGLEHVFDYPEKPADGGGYRAKGTISIRAGNFSVTAKIYYTTGELIKFAQQLQVCYDTLTGEAELLNSEGMLNLKCSVNRRGHVFVSGFFKEHTTSKNCLHFEIATDQTQMYDTLTHLSDAVKIYN